MYLELYKPASVLGKYVRLMTYFRGFNVAHEIDRLVPDGSVNLIFSLDDHPQFIYDNETLRQTQKCEKVWFSGMQSEFISISSGNHSEMLVVSFYPGKGHYFVDIPLNQIDGQVVDAEILLGNDVLHLREQVQEIICASEKFQVVENWLTSKLTDESVPAAVITYLVGNIVAKPSVNGLSTLIDKSGYSQKQVIYHFKKHVGLTPKYFQRIIRFNTALSDINRTQELDWASLALDCGYFDQAHFIKDFRHFAGINPEQYLRQKGEYTNYIPLR